MSRYTYVTWHSYVLFAPVYEHDDKHDKNNFNGQYGFKLVSSKGFGRDEAKATNYPAWKPDAMRLLDDLEQLSMDYGETWVHQLQLCKGELGISVIIRGEERLSLLTCNLLPGMRLEFVAAHANGRGVDTVVVETLEDPALGPIARLWERYSDHENIITVLEDGRLIAITNDRETAEEWRHFEWDDTSGWLADFENRSL